MTVPHRTEACHVEHRPRAAWQTAWRALGPLAALAAAALPARADDVRGVPPSPAYVQECGSCHVPYAPQLLGAASWQRLMQGLDRHFGSNASVDAATGASLQAWLGANAATGRRAEPPPQDRITQAPWFQREHRKVAARLESTGVKRMSDCGACHTRAAEGRFSERELRVPR